MGHVFISYSHKDTDYAHALASKLQGKGFDIWIDERLDYGSQWPHEVQKQLDSCSAFLLIMSPRAYASEWVQSELQRAKRKLKPVFPLLLEGEEPWLSVESTQYYDVRGEEFPDEKFYAALERAVSSPQAAGSLAPQEAKTAADHGTALRADKPNRRIMIGTVAVLALLAVVIPVVLSSLRGEPPSSPAGTATSDIQQPPAAEPMKATTTPAVPVSNEDPDSLEFTDSKGIAMRLVSAGNFIMGNSDSQYSEEKPTHTVYLDDFYIDKYEVTNAAYKVCVDDGACQPPNQASSFTRDSYYGNPEYDNFPVLFVDWEDANAYCQWRDMKLPSEAQWEKAARGPDGRTYPWGENVDDTYANYDDAVGDTTAVGSYEKGKSPYGVYDMAGNAWEWVADWFSSSYYLDTPLTNPPGPVSGEYRVLRGGSWHDQAETVTTSSRGWNQLEYFENTDFGFRCAMDGQP